MKTRRRRARAGPVAALGAAVALGAWVACTQCSGPPEAVTDGGADTGAPDRREAMMPPVVDGGADVVLPDAEPGWRYLTELSPSCDIQVPLDPSAVMHTLSWVPCASQHPACQRLDTSTWSGTQIFDATVTGDGHWLSFRIRETIPKTSDVVVYDRTNLQPINLWRVSWFGKWGLGLWPGMTTVTLSGALVGTNDRYLANGRPPFVTPSFVHVTPSFPTQPAEPGASDTTFAVDQQLTGGIIRFPVGSATWTTKTQLTRLWTPVVVGDDVFAYHEYGNNNWSQLVRVDANGAVTVMRAVANRHVTNLKVHGGWMFWMEIYGDPNYLNFAQPKAEAWAAPYTSSPTTLAQTAKKLAQLDGVYGGAYAVSFDGYYAVNAGDGNGGTLHVVRASDGAVQSFVLNQIVQQGTQGVLPAFVSKDEVWGRAVQATTNELVKLKLNAWP